MFWVSLWTNQNTDLQFLNIIPLFTLQPSHLARNWNRRIYWLLSGGYGCVKWKFVLTVNRFGNTFTFSILLPHPSRLSPAFLRLPRQHFTQLKERVDWKHIELLASSCRGHSLQILPDIKLCPFESGRSKDKSNLYSITMCTEAFLLTFLL